MAGSCFGEYGIQVSADPSASAGAMGRSKMNHNAVSCLYQTKIAGQCRIVTITWSKSIVGQGLYISMDEGKYSCKIELRPWLFWKKHGSKSFEVGKRQVEVFWDLASAKHLSGGPEPVGNFVVAIVCENEIVLRLGDNVKTYSGSNKERLFAAKPSSIQATLLSRREHLYGKKFFTTKVCFWEGGDPHEVIIECPTFGSFRSGSGGDSDDYNGHNTSASGSSGLSSGSSNSSAHSSSSRSSGKLSSSLREPRLCIRIDRKVVLQVKRLAWKFRGNQTIVIDGQQVEVFWDVHNWLFSSSGGGVTPSNAAVFMFQQIPSSVDDRNMFTQKLWISQQQLQENRHILPGFSLFLYACSNE